MPRYRLRRLSPASQAGMCGGELIERVIELPAGMAPPPGAEVVADSVAVSDWEAVVKGSEPVVNGPEIKTVKEDK